MTSPFIAGSAREEHNLRQDGGVRSKKERAMTRFGKIAAGALLMAGTALGTTAALTTPADARVVVGVGIGVPGYYGYPCCGYPYYYPYYGYPAYYGGYYGSPYVWWGGGWHWR